MKNILYIGNFNGIVGGIERYMQQSAVLLRQNGFSVHYLYMEKGGREQEKFADSFDSVQQFSIANKKFETSDMVILHNIIAVEFLQYLPVEKTFFFAHDHNIYCQRHHYYTPIGRVNCHRKYDKFVCKLCSLGRNAAPPLAEYRKFPALVLSDFMAANLRKNGFEKVFKLPAFIKTAESKTEFMPDGILRILFLGQLIRGKGADLMLKSLAELEIPFECTIAGDGKDRRMLEKTVEKFKLCDKVHFSGFVSDMENLWKNCDLFCFPIRWQEPFGLVGLEAMAHGVPIVSFDTGGVREWLADCANGLLAAERDCAALAEILKKSAENPAELERMGKCAMKLAKEKFSEENFVENFKKLQEVLK